MKLLAALVGWSRVAILCAMGTGCRGATEVVLSVRTNAPCADTSRWTGVAIYTGEPGVDVESKAPTLITQSCDSSGTVGTIAITPSGAKDELIGVRVVAGLTRKPEECRTAGYEGCIVSRRTIRFVPHASLDLVVDLTTDCTSQACDVNHTCVDGACTDTLTATAPVSDDGGVPDGPTVRCGDDGTRCPFGDSSRICCVTLHDGGPSTGTCGTAAACSSAAALLRCDDSSQCGELEDGGIGICCITFASGTGGEAVGAMCTSASACFVGQQAMCDDRNVCPLSGSACAGALYLPGYFACQL